jgi:hypothetical protein
MDLTDKQFTPPAHLLATRSSVRATVGHHVAQRRARLGPVKAFAALQPLTGLSALTGPSGEPRYGTYVMAKRLHGLVPSSN